MMPSSWPIRYDLRTSESHPLVISWITHDSFDGEIGITLCPGKYFSLAALRKKLNALPGSG